MAQSSRNQGAETPESSTTAAAESSEELTARKNAAKAEPDVVAAVSVDRNGQPDQSKDFKVLGKDVDIEGV